MATVVAGSPKDVGVLEVDAAEPADLLDDPQADIDSAITVATPMTALTFLKVPASTIRVKMGCPTRSNRVDMGK